MHIIVVGAGISGTVTALTLAQEGHSVEIIEGAQAPATGASFANAGLISPGHCFSWAEPGVVGVALKSLFGIGEGLGIHGPWTPALARWATLFAREATQTRWLTNSKAALALAGCEQKAADQTAVAQGSTPQGTISDELPDMELLPNDAPLADPADVPPVPGLITIQRGIVCGSRSI